MPDMVNHVVGDLAVRIEETLRVGFAGCVNGPGVVFQLADERDAVDSKSPDGEIGERLLSARRTRPAKALAMKDTADGPWAVTDTGHAPWTVTGAVGHAMAS